MCLGAYTVIIVYYLLHVFLIPQFFLIQRIEVGAAFILVTQCFLIIVFSVNPKFDFGATTGLLALSLILAGALRKKKLEHPHQITCIVG